MIWLVVVGVVCFLLGAGLGAKGMDLYLAKVIAQDRRRFGGEIR